MIITGLFLLCSVALNSVSELSVLLFQIQLLVKFIGSHKSCFSMHLLQTGLASRTDEWYKIIVFLILLHESISWMDFVKQIKRPD